MNNLLGRVTRHPAGSLCIVLDGTMLLFLVLYCIVLYKTIPTGERRHSSCHLEFFSLWNIHRCADDR